MKDKPLAALLIVLAVCAMLSCVTYAHGFGRLLLQMPRWAAYSFVGLPLLRLIALWAVWWRSRLGVLSYLGLTAGDLVICSIVFSSIGSIYGVLGSALLVAFTWRKWPQMLRLPANYSLKRTAADELR